MMRGALLLLCALAAGCGAALENEACTKSTSSYFGTEAGDCADGLVCLVADTCQGDCAGTCRRKCTGDADCGAGTTCSGDISPENGGGKFCRQP